LHDVDEGKTIEDKIEIDENAPSYYEEENKLGIPLKSYIPSESSFRRRKRLR